jgi:hypothetical protein
MEPLFEVHSKSGLLALPTNIRQGQKRMAIANAQAYYNTLILMAIKSLNHSSLYYNTFMAVIIVLL